MDNLANTIKKTEAYKEKINLRAKTETEIKVVSMIQNLINQYQKYIYPSSYKYVKNKVLFAGDLAYANMVLGNPNGTAAVFPLIDFITDTFKDNLYDSISTPRVSAKRSSDIGLVSAGQDFIDSVYDRSGIINAEQLARDEAILLGTSYIAAGWDDRLEKLQYFDVNSGNDKTVSIDISEPEAEHVSFFEMFLELSTKDFYNARYKVRRKILSLDEIKYRYGGLIDFDDKSITDNILASEGQYISPYDFTKIYDINYYANAYTANGMSTWETGGETKFLEDNVLSLKIGNPLLEVCEYWSGKNGLSIFINGFQYYDGKSPYPHGDPFGIIVHEAVPGTFLGRGFGHKLSSLQQQATSLWCKIRDAISQHVAPMYSIIQGMAPKNEQGATYSKITYYPNKVIEVQEGIKNGGINPIQFVNPDMIQLARDEINPILQRAAEIAGVNSYTQGGSGKVERSFGAANLKVGILKSRLKPIVSSIQNLDKRMLENWLTFAAMTGKDSIEVKSRTKEGDYKYTTINPTDLMDKLDVDVVIDSLVEQTRVARFNEATQLLQSIAAININPISKLPIVNPDSLVAYIADQTGNNALSAMTEEESESFAKRHIDIARRLQEATTPTEPATPVDGQQQIQQSQGDGGQLDLASIQGFMGQ